jgi:3-dehydroquinate synthase
MINIDVNTTHKSKIEFFDYRAFFEKIDKNSIYIIDQNVKKLHFENFEIENSLILTANESIKEFDNLKIIFDFLLQKNAKKDSIVYCIGGGTLSDIVGYACSIFKRGIRLRLVPTTLLSITDASIGGKNGINYKNVKNLIGNYYLPDNVFIDLKFLETLDKVHFLSGLVEVIKIAIVSSPALFEYIVENKDYIKNRENKILKKIIEESINLKIRIVNQDYQDNSIRKYLNFGHSFGHSFELLENIPHGFAVAKGMMIALEQSRVLYKLNDDLIEKITNLLEYFEIPISLPLDLAKSLELLEMDKKNDYRYINLVLLKDIGNPVIQKIKINELRNTFKNMLES